MIQETPDIFVSYSHKDVRFVNKLIADLRKSGFLIWRDEDHLHVGDYSLDQITAAVKACKLLIAVISENYKASTWCKHEIKLKLSEEVSKGRIHVLPVRLDETDPEELVPAKGWADFRDHSTYERSFKNLHVSISYHLDPLIAEDKRESLENLLKQSYVDACYGSLSAKEALARFHTAATMNPESTFIWRALGYIYHFHLVDFANAEKYYLRALELQPNNAPVIRALGVLYLRDNKKELALKFLKHSEELGYDSKHEWKEYWGVYYNDGPHSIGGIPMLFDSTREAVRKFLETEAAINLENELDDGGV
jgi:tetratricopeptide (TPR) repeat protein